MVAVGVAGLEGSRLARTERRLAALFDQDQLARNDEDQLVFGFVPVALRGRSARRQARQVDPELGQSARVPQRLASARIRHCLERRRIDRAYFHRHPVDVDLGHPKGSYAAEWREPVIA